MRIKRRSQKVKLLIEGYNLLAACLACLDLLRVAAAASLAPWTSSWALASIADENVELCDLVSVLARSRHLDWPSPVEVIVAQCET